MLKCLNTEKACKNDERRVFDVFPASKRDQVLVKQYCGKWSTYKTTVMLPHHANGYTDNEVLAFSFLQLGC